MQILIMLSSLHLSSFRLCVGLFACSASQCANRASQACGGRWWRVCAGFIVACCRRPTSPVPLPSTCLPPPSPAVCRPTPSPPPSTTRSAATRRLQLTACLLPVPQKSAQGHQLRRQRQGGRRHTGTGGYDGLVPECPAIRRSPGCWHCAARSNCAWRGG